MKIGQFNKATAKQQPWYLGTALAMAMPIAQAAIIDVTTTQAGVNADGLCSLSEAIDNANADDNLSPIAGVVFPTHSDCAMGSGADTISLMPGVYSYTAPNQGGATGTAESFRFWWYGPNALPAIASDITIEGNGAVIERADNEGIPPFRFFYVGADPLNPNTLDYTSPGAGHLTLRNLTLKNGLAKGGDSGKGGAGAGMGGAVFSQGSVALEAVTMVGNTALGGSAVLASGYAGAGLGGENATGNTGTGFGGGFSGIGALGGNGGSNGRGAGGAGFGLTENGGNAADGGGVGGGVNTGTAGGGTGAYRGPGSAGNGSSGGSGVSWGFSGSGGDGGAFGNGGLSSSNAGSGGGGVGGGAGASRDAGGGGFGGGGACVTTYGSGSGYTNKAGAGGSGGFGAGGGCKRGTSFGGGSGDTNYGGAGAGLGGAVFNMQGQLSITNSTLTENTAMPGTSLATSGTQAQGFGGAVFNMSGSVTSTLSTLAFNTATNDGGAIYSVVHDTYNVRTAHVDLIASILSNSTGGRSDLATDKTIRTYATFLGAATVSNTDSIVMSSTTLGGADALPVDFLSADPQLLAPLADNGGYTQTLAIAESSPAIDAADCPVTVQSDQRGIDRPFNGACDIGAYELRYAATLNLSPASLDFGEQTVATMSDTQTVTLSVSDTDLPLMLDEIYLDGDAADFSFASNNCPAVIAQGASCEIALSFNPATKGAKSAALTVLSNSINGTDTVAISGDGLGRWAELSSEAKYRVKWRLLGFEIRLKYQALFTDILDGSPVAGKSVTFKADSVPGCTAATDVNGMVSCEVTFRGYPFKLNKRRYTAIFDGDEVYEEASDEGRFKRTR